MRNATLWQTEPLTNDCVHVQNIHVTAYSPMGTPPSSAMFKDYQPALVMNDPVVKDMAKKYNKNVGQVQPAHVHISKSCVCLQQLH